MPSSDKDRDTVAYPKPFKVEHDFAKEIKQQQDILNQAILQHPDEPEVQQALRAQKDALGVELDKRRREQQLLSSTPNRDGGGAFAANLGHRQGGLANFLARRDAKVTVIKRNINATIDDT